MSQKILSLKELVVAFAKDALNPALVNTAGLFARFSHLVEHIVRIDGKLNAEIRARQELQVRFDELIANIYAPVPEDANEAEDQLFRAQQMQEMQAEVAKSNLENKLPEPEKQAPVNSPAVQAYIDGGGTPPAPNGSQKVQAS